MLACVWIEPKNADLGFRLANAAHCLCAQLQSVKNAFLG